MADRKALGRAAKNAITQHIVELTTVTETNLETVILACEQEKLITSAFKGTLLDGLTGRSSRDRARKLVDHIQSSVGIVPSFLDTFLFVLVDLAEESPVTKQVADDVAASYGHELPKYCGGQQPSSNTPMTADANKNLLDKAMKEGYVTAKWTKFSVSGAPGTGKSSFLKLLYNEDPPNCHNSTPVIKAREPRIISATVGDDSKWRKIDYESLKKKITQGVKHSIRPHKPEEETADIADLSTEGHDSAVDISSLPQSAITQEIIDLLPHVEKSEELYRSHWIYGVDTGGQAAFLDIAPALLRYHSVNILTHKLDERLEDKAKFFFSIEGYCIGEPVEKQITNLQLIEASFRSVLSVDLPELPYIYIKHVQEPYYIVLGTFLDQLHEYDESLQTKNTILSSALDNFREVTIMYRGAGNDVIFPVNTLDRDDYTKELASRIRRKICQYYIEAEIPIRWFFFQLELQKTSKSDIVSLSNCLEIGMTLQMDVSDVQAALMYYHDLTIFLYFPKILPNVVFVHPQPLFERLSDLISISLADAVDCLEKNGISLYNPAAHKELKDEGTFQEDLLTSSNSYLSQGYYPEFTPQDFLKIMTSLFIIASLPEIGKYFIPTVLPTTTSFTEYKSIPAPFKQYTDPLILSWDMKSFPRGVFPALVVNLLHRNHSPKFELRRPLRSTLRYRNAITLRTDYGDILLVDGIYWMAIYSTDPLKRCYALHEAVHTGILEVVTNFQCKANFNKLEEYFYCKICSVETSEHFCYLNVDQKTVTCCDNHAAACINESCQLPWLSVKGYDKMSLELLLDKQPTKDELISYARTAKWNQLGVKLGLDRVDLDGCHDCTSMYQLWIMQKGKGATRRILLNALRAIRQNNVADVYEDYLKATVGNNESV